MSFKVYTYLDLAALEAIAKATSATIRQPHYLGARRHHDSFGGCTALRAHLSLTPLSLRLLWRYGLQLSPPAVNHLSRVSHLSTSILPLGSVFQWSLMRQ